MGKIIWLKFDTLEMERYAVKRERECRLMNHQNLDAPNPMQQTCKACGKADKFDFHVPDKLWLAITPADLQNRVVCLACFDEFAQKKGLSYANEIKELYFAGRQATFIFKVEQAICANSQPGYLLF